MIRRGRFVACLSGFSRVVVSFRLRCSSFPTTAGREVAAGHSGEGDGDLSIAIVRQFGGGARREHYRTSGAQKCRGVTRTDDGEIAIGDDDSERSIGACERKRSARLEKN